MTVITLVLNQTWIAVYMMITYANPSNACHAALMVAILAGFASGFVVTKQEMPIGWVVKNSHKECTITATNR